MYEFVLVRWTSGRDAGKHTVLDMSCVRGHELLSFAEDGRLQGSSSADTPVVVEWRAGKKPKIGWPVFDAVLIRASGNC